jgi:hypothetical protein
MRIHIPCCFTSCPPQPQTVPQLTAKPHLWHALSQLHSPWAPELRVSSLASSHLSNGPRQVPRCSSVPAGTGGRQRPANKQEVMMGNRVLLRGTIIQVQQRQAATKMHVTGVMRSRPV